VRTRRTLPLTVALLALTSCEVRSAIPAVPALPAATFPGAGGSSGGCDADADGIEAWSCGGLDCDDEDASVRPGADESCGNGRDDDCDGLVDEDCACAPGDLQACWEGLPEQRGVGACSDGVRRCTAEGVWGPCAFAVLPGPEAEGCDRLDSDCDGIADPPSCSGCPDGAVEICGNGLDDDCDWTIDPADLCAASCDAASWACCSENPPALHGFACEEGSGLEPCNVRACLDLDGAPETTCSKACDASGCVCGRSGPTGEVAPVADCGFSTPCARLDCADEQRQPCYAGPPATLGVGICRGGTHSCTSDGPRRAWTSCEDEQTPVPEICGNDVDDDCDGLIDEEDGFSARRCPRPTCPEGAVELCGNGLDDDCDGFADEACPAQGTQPCWTGPLECRGVGACRDGMQAADDGTWGRCTGEVLPTPEQCGDGIDSDCDGLGGVGEPEEPSCCVPSPEVCNGRDDDCDGLSDEGLLDRCGQCAGTGSCYGLAITHPADCSQPGRICDGIEAAPFDDSLITLAHGTFVEGEGPGEVLYVTRVVSGPKPHHEVVQVDTRTGSVVSVLDTGAAWNGEVAALADGSTWLQHIYTVEHVGADGSILCRTDPAGSTYISTVAPEPGGDLWVVLAPNAPGYLLRRYSGTEVIAESAPGVGWSDGIPRCAVVDLQPDLAATDLWPAELGSPIVDGNDRMWYLSPDAFVWAAGRIDVLPAADSVYLGAVLAPDGGILAGWPLRRIDGEALLAGAPDAIRELGSYGEDVTSQQALRDGSVVGYLYHYPEEPLLVRVDGRTGAELARFPIPASNTPYITPNLVVDGRGRVWTGKGDRLFRLDLASREWETFAIGGTEIVTSRFGLAGIRDGEADDHGSWSQDVDAGSSRIAWGELSWESVVPRGSGAMVRVRFANDLPGLAASGVICGPFPRSPADLSGCSQGLRHARIEIELEGVGHPLVGDVRLTWDRPL
jgi:hypothetical protein